MFPTVFQVSGNWLFVEAKTTQMLDYFALILCQTVFCIPCL